MLLWGGLSTCPRTLHIQMTALVGGPTTLARIHRLRDERPTRLLATAAYAAAAAILVVPTLAVAIPWLTELSRLISAA